MVRDLSPTHSATALERVGKPRRWARDLAVVGGVTSTIAPWAGLTMLGETSPGFVACAAIAGAVTGSVLGGVMPGMLRKLRECSIITLLFGGLGVGGLWGASVGAAAGLAIYPTALYPSAIVAGLVGALQFGWLWFPYLRRIVAGKRTWPLLLASAALVPFMTALALYLFIFLF